MFTFNTADFETTLNSFLNNQEKKEEKKVVKKLKIPKPKEIKSFLDQYVIGQENAKKMLSVAVHNHYLRINSDTKDGVDIKKSNILMIGNSGSGKTLLAQTIAKFLEVPFVSVDATEITPTGIVGKDVNTIPEDLIRVAGGDKEIASRGVVFIDEIDKLASNNMLMGKQGSRIGGESTQAVLLNILESDKFIRSSNYRYIGQEMSEFDSKNILFICGGAFAGIEELLGSNNLNKQIGFSTINKTRENIEEYNIDQISTEEIIKYGIMPELVGRLPILIKLKPLYKNDLKDILIKPQNALIKQYQKLLLNDKVNIEFTDDALDIIAEMAIKTRTGARGLRGIVEEIITNIIYEIPDNMFKKKCVITASHIMNNTVPKFEFGGLMLK